MAGTVLYGTLTNGIAQGKTFAALCLENKAKPVSLPSFSLSTRAIPELENHLTPDQLKQIAFSTPPGTVGAFRPTTDGGVIVYVKQKLPMDATRMRDDMPSFLASLRSARQNEAFNLWFRKEAEKGLRDVPQTPAAPAMSSRAGKAT